MLNRHWRLIQCQCVCVLAIFLNPFCASFVIRPYTSTDVYVAWQERVMFLCGHMMCEILGTSLFVYIYCDDIIS
jgi:hypothetical protein